MGEGIIEPPVTVMGPGTRVLVLVVGTQMCMGILTQTFPRMDKHTAISNPRRMDLGPNPVNRSSPALIMDTTPGPPTTLSKGQGTTSLLEIVNANVVNAVNAASIVIVTGNVDVATDIPNRIQMVYLPPNLILILPSPPRSRPGLKTSPQFKTRSTDTMSSRSEQL